MKKALTRQIGYKKPNPFKAAAKVKSLPAEIVLEKPLSELKPNGAATAAEVIEWIKQHPLFKWGGMCVEIGIDKGNFGRTMEEKEPYIKPDVLSKIESVISEYGFK